MAVIAHEPHHSESDPRRGHPGCRQHPGHRRSGLFHRLGRGGVLLPGRHRHLHDAAQGRAGSGRLLPAGHVGGLHHHLRLLDRYRPRRNPDLGDPVPLPLAVAHRGLPRHRSDDGLRGDDGRALPDHSHRPAVVLLLAAALSERPVPLAEFQVAADLGRLRDLHLPHGFHHVPLRGTGAGHRRRAGQDAGLASQRVFDLLVGLEGHRQPVAALHPGLPVSGCLWRLRWCSRCTPWCPGTSR